VDSATTSLESEIPVNGNVRTFDFPTAPGGHDAAGFYVRTDTPGNHHFARVMVRNNGGKILQSIPPNRYIELETSYQISANVPFAKASRGNPPRGIEPTPRDNPITQYLEIP
jgi:hypothetical protein